MNKKYWTPEIPLDYQVFDLLVNIPIVRENIVDKIILFDKTLLYLGHIYKVFDRIKSDTDVHIALEEFERIKRDEFKKSNYTEKKSANDTFLGFNLLDFSNEILFNYVLERKKYYLDIPFLANIANPQNNDSYESLEELDKSLEYIRLLSVYPGIFLYYDEINESDNYLSVEIYSKSNIWFDDISVAKINNEKKIFNPPISNRTFSYRISPYFNSFLNGVYEVTRKLGGTIELMERDMNKVTAEGYILLDGQVVFQEDIDSGKVKIPD